jgi:hypothetical protein
VSRVAGRSASEGIRLAGEVTVDGADLMGVQRSKGGWQRGQEETLGNVDVRVKVRVSDSRQGEFRLKARGFASVALGSVHLEEEINPGSSQWIYAGVFRLGREVATVNERV